MGGFYVTARAMPNDPACSLRGKIIRATVLVLTVLQPRHWEKSLKNKFLHSLPILDFRTV
jgi:hypothetical protein